MSKPSSSCVAPVGGCHLRHLQFGGCGELEMQGVGLRSEMAESSPKMYQSLSSTVVHCPQKHLTNFGQPKNGVHTSCLTAVPLAFPFGHAIGHAGHVCSTGPSFGPEFRSILRGHTPLCPAFGLRDPSGSVSGRAWDHGRPWVAFGLRMARHHL